MNRRFALPFLVATTLLLLLAFPRRAEARYGAGGDFGLGLVLGSPTGLTSEIYLSHATSLDLALGIDAFEHGDNVYFHLTYLAHLVDFARGGSVGVPLYVGIGGFFLDHGRFDGDAADIGARFPLGIHIDFRRVPFQISLEASLRLFLLEINHEHHDFLDLGAAAAFRFFF